VLVRRAVLQPLDTEKARRSLQNDGRSQNKLQELQQGVVRAALALANIIAPYALAQMLDVNLQTVSITEGIDAVVVVIEGKGISTPYLTDIVNSWKSLLADIDNAVCSILNARAHLTLIYFLRCATLRLALISRCHRARLIFPSLSQLEVRQTSAHAMGPL